MSVSDGGTRPPAETRCRMPQPQQWQPSWIEKLKSLQNLNEENQMLKKNMQKIVEAGDLWGSEGKQHHEAVYLARISLAQSSV